MVLCTQFIYDSTTTVFYALQFQQMWKCKYIETSAKNGTNVTELFEELLKLVELYENVMACKCRSKML